jgi:hypothetical protein
MTNHQNHRRWAIDQQKQARALSAAKQEVEQRHDAEIREYQNMFYGNWFARTLRGEQ